MAKRATVSAGLLLYHRTGGELEVLLAHPGGPFWAHRDAGAWSIPKGLVEEGEDVLVAACREFEEETGLRPTGPFLSLGSVRQKAGKLIYAWAWQGDADRVAAGLRPMAQVSEGRSLRLVRPSDRAGEAESGPDGVHRPARGPAVIGGFASPRAGSMPPA